MFSEDKIVEREQKFFYTSILFIIVNEKTKEELAIAGAMAVLTFFTTIIALKIKRYIQMKI